MYIHKDRALYPYPKEFTPADQKTAKWHLDYAKALYGHVINNKSQLNIGGLDNLQENRMYGAGTQDWKQYQTQLLDMQAQTTQNQVVDDLIAKGWMNVNFKDIVSVLPKFKSIIVGLFTTQKHEVDCYAYNEMATEAREELKYELWTKATFKDLIAQVKAFIGNTQEETEFIPSSVRELQMYEQLGGLKLKEEIGMETVIAEAENVSDYTHIEEELISDMFDTKMMCTQDYVDINTGMVRIRRVDPLNIGVVLDADQKKVIKAAEMRYMSVSELRGHTLVEIRDGKEVILSGEDLEEVLVKVCRMYEDQFGNGKMPNALVNPDPINQPFSYDYMVFPVVQCEFVTVDRRSKVERPLKSGVTGMFTESETKKPGKVGDKEYKFEDVRVVRQVSMILGSNVIFQYGLIYDMPRPTLNDTCTTYHFAKIDGVPFARMCKRAADDIQLANLRIQNALAMAKPNGFSYEYSTLNIPTKDGKNVDFLDIIRMHTQTGSHIHSARSPRGAPIKMGEPIIPLTGGIGPLLNECLLIIQKAINDIQMMIGLSEIMDASTPNPRIGVGVSELAQAASNNALRQIYNRMIWLREDTASNVALRVQSIAKRSGGFNGYAELIGKPAWKALQVGGSFTGIIQHIRFIAAPSEIERNEMEIALEKAMAVGKNGSPLLTTSDYFAVKRMIKARSSLKLVQVLLSERERIATLEQLQREQINMQTNAKYAQETEQLKAANEVKKATTLSQLKREEETHKVNEEIRKYKELKAIGIRNVPGMPDIKAELENAPAPGSPEEAAIQESGQPPMFQQ